MTTPIAETLPQTCDLIRQGIAQKLHLGMQVFVSQRGNVIVDTAIGRNTPQQTLGTDTLMLWMSSGKPITATAVLQFFERGALDLDQSVSDFIPEFAQADKEAVTIQQLLNHTAGLRPVVSGWPHKSWDEIIAKICKAPLQRDWIPGESGGYDPARSWFILGEILKRIDGRSIDRIVREDILEPLEMMDCWMSIPRQIFRAYDDRVGVIYSLKDKELHPTHGHEQTACTQPSPGGSMRGPANQLGLFYDMLLNRGTSRSGAKILEPESVLLMTSRQRENLYDQTFQHIVDFGLGLIVNSNRYNKELIPYGFGRHAGDNAFGHGGAQSSIGFVDPEHELIVVVIANGCPGEELHNERFRELNSAIYQDLGLDTHA